MPKSPSIVDYSEAQCRFSGQMSALAFGAGSAEDAATAVRDSMATMRAFRSAPRAHRIANLSA